METQELIIDEDIEEDIEYNTYKDFCYDSNFNINYITSNNYSSIYDAEDILPTKKQKKIKVRKMRKSSKFEY